MSPLIDIYTLARIISGRPPEPDYASLSAADWDMLMRSAQAQGVAPLLYWALSRSARLRLTPAAVQKSLRAMYHGVRMNNQQIVAELMTLGEIFDRVGIPVVALKGVSVALELYPDIGLRPMADLDILVPASELSEAVRLARFQGYVDAVPGLGEVLNHAVCLRKSSAPFTTLELHHTLVADGAHSYAVPVDWFWTQTEPLDGSIPDRRLGGLLALTPTAQVLYAAAHSMLQHGGANTCLRWYYDLDRLISIHASRMDWDLLLSQARTFEWTSAVLAALSQTVVLYGTPIPDAVLSTLAGRSDRNAGRVAAMQDQRVTTTLDAFQKLGSLSWPGRFRWILAVVVPSPVYMRWRYPVKTLWELPFWYPIRWWGIVRDALKSLFLLVRHAGGRSSYLVIQPDGSSDTGR